MLDPSEGNKSFLVYEGGQLIGHAALRPSAEAKVYKMSFLYLLPQRRSKGLGGELVALLEEYAIEDLSANKLILKARVYNPRAIRCYVKCGFQEDSQEDSLVRMSKELKRS